MMKVAYILHNTSLASGSTKSFLALLSGVLQRGVSPIVILPDSGGVYTTLKNMGIPTYVVNFRPCTYPRTYGRLKGTLLFLPKLLARIYVNSKASSRLAQISKLHGVDIIHSNTCVIDIGLNAARRLHLPHIFHVREYADIDFHQHFYPTQHRLYTMLNAPCNYNICITKDIQRHHSLNTKPNSEVIYNGIRHKSPIMPPHASGTYYLYAGSIEATKGIMDLLKAYHRYLQQSKSPLRLLIAGSFANPVIHDEVTRYVTSHNLSRHIDFLGARNDIDSLMMHARATIIPSQHEAFGRVMPEAMYNRCPVIARNTGGSKEQMLNAMNESGQECAFAYESTDELAALMVNVSKTSTDILSAMTQRAFSVVNNLYTTERYVDAVYKVYEQTIRS